MEICEREIEFFVQEFHKHANFDLTGYSRKSLGRRVSKILQDYRFENLETLLQTLEEKPHITPRIIEEITVNTTELFRDPPLWEYLYLEVFNRFSRSEPVHLWHIACSSGEEVYSALGLFHQLGLLENVHSLGTDLNSKTLERARNAVYSYRFHQKYMKNLEVVHKSISGHRNDHHRDGLNHLFRINSLADEIITDERLKRQAEFKVFDVTRPDGLVRNKADVIFCRNLLIYFKYKYQERILKHLYDKVKPGGYLILGKHEVMSEHMKNLFIPLKHQVYRKKDTTA